MTIEIMGWYKVRVDRDGNVEYLPLSAEEWELENSRASDEEIEALDRQFELEAYDWETRWL